MITFEKKYGMSEEEVLGIMPSAKGLIITIKRLMEENKRLKEYINGSISRKRLRKSIEK